MRLYQDNPDVMESEVSVSTFRDEVLKGLEQRPRRISPRWFYDRRGSELFEAITELPEYYPTRTERAILANNAKEVGILAGSGRVVVEFGSGSSSKTPVLLSAVRPSAYVPIDISGEFLRESVARLQDVFPDLPIHPVEGDFTRTLDLPGKAGKEPRLGFFPGSTIGNLLMAEAVDLLRAMANTLGHDAMLLVGADLIKDVEILVPAYNDAQGVTAEFNLNLLHRINRELGGSIPVESFQHVALWNDAESRIEMHLRARCEVSFRVANRSFCMKKDETIHTENSIKYGKRDLGVLLRAGGWTPIADWTDARGLFSMTLAAAGN